MRYVLLVLCFLSFSIQNTIAIELVEVLPCKPAAVKYCSKDMSLYQCGDILAAYHRHINEACKEVLKRFGKL